MEKSKRGGVNMVITSQNLHGMYSGFNALFNKAFDEATPQYEKVAMVVPSSGSDETYGWGNCQL